MDRRPTDKRVHPDAQSQRVTGWAGAALVAIALAGLAIVPGLDIVWLLLLFFGVITVPQVLLWRRAERKSAEISRGAEDAEALTPEDREIERRKRAVAYIAGILFVIAIVGLVAAPHFYVIWVFLLVFALTTTPRWIGRRLRDRRARGG